MPQQSTKGTGPGTARDRRERLQAASPYRNIGPQPGPQYDLLATPADIALIGGAAGGGKTFGLLMEGARHVDNPRYGAVFLRENMPQIKLKGGAWEKASEIYPGMGALPNLTDRTYHFRSGATVAFKAIAREEELESSWGSSQIPTILIDQAEAFSERMIFGLIARNRTDIGIRPVMRLSANPDPDCFLRTFIEWWLDSDGYAIPERSGVIRWFTRIGDNIVWADTRQELVSRYKLRSDAGLSFTFIPAKLSDNPILEELDPGYRAKLESLPWQERERLLGDAGKGGNWKIKVGAGMFQEQFWKLRDFGPEKAQRIIYWDTADTSAKSGQNTASTVGVLLAKTTEGIFVEECCEVWASEHERDSFIVNTAKLLKMQYGHVVHWFEREPGGGGKRDANRNVRLLQGFQAHVHAERDDKVTRAKPWASYVQSGNVYIVTRGGANTWVKGFIDEHSSFPLAKKKDKVDAASGAFNKLSLKPSGGGNLPAYAGTDNAPTDELERLGAFR